MKGNGFRLMSSEPILFRSTVLYINNTCAGYEFKINQIIQHLMSIIFHRMVCNNYACCFE